MKHALTSTTRFALILIACAAIAALAGSRVQALDTHTRVVSPVRVWVPDDLARFDPAWVHVKFVEGSGVELAPGRFVDAAGDGLDDVNAVLAGESITTIRRTFTGDRATLRAWKARGEARERACRARISRSGSTSAWRRGRPAVAAPGQRPQCLRGGRDRAPGGDRRARLDRVSRARPPARALTACPRPTSPASRATSTPRRSVSMRQRPGRYPAGTAQGCTSSTSSSPGREDHEDFNFAPIFYIGGAPAESDPLRGPRHGGPRRDHRPAQRLRGQRVRARSAATASSPSPSASGRTSRTTSRRRSTISTRATSG